MKPFAIAVLITLICSVTGCQTTIPSAQQKLARYESIARLTAYTAAAVCMAERPTSKEAFIQTRNAVEQLISKEQIDPALLALTLFGNLPIRELQGDRAIIMISAGMLLCQESFGLTLVDTPEVAKAFGRGIVTGFTIAIEQRTRYPLGRPD